MTKIKGPLHSLAASGSVAGLFSFRQTAGGSVLTKKPAPYPQTSPNQLANQQRMTDARTSFLALSSTDLALWQVVAVARKRSAWASYFAEYQYQFIQTPNAPLIPEPYL